MGGHGVAKRHPGPTCRADGSFLPRCPLAVLDESFQRREAVRVRVDAFLRSGESRLLGRGAYALHSYPVEPHALQ